MRCSSTLTLTKTSTEEEARTVFYMCEEATRVLTSACVRRNLYTVYVIAQLYVVDQSFCNPKLYVIAKRFFFFFFFFRFALVCSNIFYKIEMPISYDIVGRLQYGYCNSSGSLAVTNQLSDAMHNADVYSNELEKKK